MKKGSAGVRWTEQELKLKGDALLNSARYSRRQKSLVNRFFSTIVDFGGERLSNLADITVDEMGDTQRYVLIFFYFNFTYLI